MVIKYIDYSDGNTTAYFNGFKFKKDKKTGYYLCSKEVDGVRKRLHVAVWEHFNGKAPKGKEVHHKDFNKDNNDITNLVALTREEHERIHIQARTEEQKNKLRENVVKNAMPKAKAWHSTPEGKAWHSEHAKEIHKNASVNKYVCTYCGKEFETKNVYAKGQNHFCSNKCKSAFRRKSGVDDIEKVCSKCGKTYKENKYRKTQLCPSCRNCKH